jgi:hypothetical protein
MKQKPAGVPPSLHVARAARNSWRRAGLIAGFALLLGACQKDPMTQMLAEAEQVKARDWSHLAGLPEPQAVLSRIGHNDPLVATVRQCQVLTKLHELLDDDPLFAPTELGSMPERSVRLRDAYSTLIEQDLYRRFSQLHRSSGNARDTWRQACEGTASQWRAENIGDEDWLALLAPPSREVAEQQLAVYAKWAPAAAAARETAQQERAAARRREPLRVMGIGILIMLGGLVMMRRGWRIQHELNRYEFENRNEAGVVQFESYEASQRHRRRRYFANQFLFMGGAIVAIVGFVVFVARMGE